MRPRLSRATALCGGMRRAAWTPPRQRLGKEGEMNYGDPDMESAELPDLLVLAAVARASRHRTAPGAGVTQREIYAHLGAGPRSAAARGARSALERLGGGGALRRERRHGVAVWRVTARGDRLLAGAAAAAASSGLPESPQHRSWRVARERAADAIERLRRALHRDLREAERLLACSGAGQADAWFVLAERLGRDAWRVGAATYCLREWPEPSDDRADVDPGSAPADSALAPRERERLRRLRAGRRNVALWES
jgi:hypothetical protein